MAVIITNMNMPRSCADCPMCHPKGKDEPWNYCCFATMDDINIEEWDKERYITCPLKSTDEMIAEIKEKSFVDYDEAYTDNGKCLITEDGVIEIINKYCKENTDDNNNTL